MALGLSSSESSSASEGSSSSDSDSSFVPSSGVVREQHFRSRPPKRPRRSATLVRPSTPPPAAARRTRRPRAASRSRHTASAPATPVPPPPERPRTPEAVPVSGLPGECSGYHVVWEDGAYALRPLSPTPERNAPKRQRRGLEGCNLGRWQKWPHWLGPLSSDIADVPDATMFRGPAPGAQPGRIDYVLETLASQQDPGERRRPIDNAEKMLRHFRNSSFYTDYLRGRRGSNGSLNVNFDRSLQLFIQEEFRLSGLRRDPPLVGLERCELLIETVQSLNPALQLPFANSALRGWGRILPPSVRPQGTPRFTHND